MKFILLFLSVAGAATATIPVENEQPVEMDPYSVSAFYPAIEVRFVLAGKNLSAAESDQVKQAYISAVVFRSAESGPEMVTGDRIEAIDGVPLQGKTLLEVADLLDQARRKGIPQWRLRYGLETRTVSFDGDWLVPLPGLKR